MSGDIAALSGFPFSQSLLVPDLSLKGIQDTADTESATEANYTHTNMPDSNSTSPASDSNPDQNPPQLNVVPDPAPEPHRGLQNKEVAEALCYAGEICTAAKLPEFAPHLLKRGITVPFIAAIEGDIVLAGQKSTAAIQCDALRKDATESESLTGKKLLKDLQTIQGAARTEFMPEHPAMLDGYLVGEPLAQSRPLLEQNSLTIINRANADRPANMETEFIVQATQLRENYLNDQGSQTSEGGKGKLSRAERNALVKSITGRRKKIQYAADTLWPHGEVTSVAARTQFKLPQNRPYSY